MPCMGRHNKGSLFPLMWLSRWYRIEWRLVWQQPLRLSMLWTTSWGCRIYWWRNLYRPTITSQRKAKLWPQSLLIEYLYRRFSRKYRSAPRKVQEQIYGNFLPDHFCFLAHSSDTLPIEILWGAPNKLSLYFHATQKHLCPHAYVIAPRVIPCWLCNFHSCILVSSA